MTKTYYKFRIERNDLEEIRKLVLKEYENAKYFAEMPDQKWKEGWKEEAEKWRHILEMIGMSEEIPF